MKKIKPFRQTLLYRLRLTWMAWKASNQWAPLAVIYDEGPPDDPGREEYYGFFKTEPEATAYFGMLEDKPMGYSPKLVLVLKAMKGKEDDPTG